MPKNSLHPAAEAGISWLPGTYKEDVVPAAATGTLEGSVGKGEGVNSELSFEDPEGLDPEVQRCLGVTHQC